MNLARENLTKYLPSLITIENELSLNWKKIDQLYSEEIEKRVKLLEDKESIPVSPAIFDAIIESEKGNLVAIGYLDFADKLFQELAMHFTKSEISLLKDNVRNFLTRLDSRHIEYLGEIMVVNQIKKNMKCTLISTEARLNKGKSIDFKLRLNDQNSYILLEVYNIHLGHGRVESSDEKLKSFLDTRLKGKISSKKAISSEEIFILAPVFWGEDEDIDIYSEYFKRNRMHIKNVLEPAAYAGYRDKNTGRPIHFFGTISTLPSFGHPS
ncbi:MAG TPA: hypothetical protein VK806_06755 [Bacteroidia bacterium]|jgi:hypothetical protein|nr:hypothetical protein [Bacteroidia bacterium]